MAYRAEELVPSLTSDCNRKTGPSWRHPPLAKHTKRACPDSHLKGGRSQWGPGLTNSDKLCGHPDSIQGSELTHTNIYSIYDPLEPQDLQDWGCSSISERSFRTGPVRMVDQKPET